MRSLLPVLRINVEMFNESQILVIILSWPQTSLKKHALICDSPKKTPWQMHMFATFDSAASSTSAAGSRTPCGLLIEECEFLAQYGASNFINLHQRFVSFPVSMLWDALQLSVCTFWILGPFCSIWGTGLHAAWHCSGLEEATGVYCSQKQ